MDSTRLDAMFPLYSPGARRLYHFEAHGERQLLNAEIRRTLDALAASAPARIERGFATEEEAHAAATLWLAIAEDLEAWTSRGPVWLQTAPTIAELHQALRAKNGVSWVAKVEALRREIIARRDGQGAAIAKGTLTRDQARDQLERIEAVHDLFWRHGFAFDGTREELRAMSGPILDANLVRDQQEGIAA